MPDDQTAAGGGTRHWLLHELPIGHPLRSQPLGPMAAQCRNLHSKEWRDLARWHIARCAYDDLGEAWTATGEFRVRAS